MFFVSHFLPSRNLGTPTSRTGRRAELSQSDRVPAPTTHIPAEGGSVVHRAGQPLYPLLLDPVPAAASGS